MSKKKAITDKVQTEKKSSESVKKAEQRKKELHKKYKEEEKVSIHLSPMYRPYFGNVMRVMINGVSIFFKVDGKAQKVPKTFAAEIESRRRAIDTMLTRQNKLANIESNHERSPGELNLF